MFELNERELTILRSQTGSSSWGGVRYPPMAFSEQGVAMLSSVLTSDQAIEVNIQIMRIFTRAKEMLAMHQEILMNLQQLVNRVVGHDHQITIIFESLHELLNPKRPPKRQIIGFKPESQ
jgi:ORF6N domain